MDLIPLPEGYGLLYTAQESANYDLVTLQPRLSYTASGAPC
jgi:hypothetical protein